MTVLFRIFDVIGGPFVFQLVLRGLTRASVLTDAEISAASAVLGAGSIRYRSVRVTEGGVLRLVFKLNGNRAVTLFHTINLPGTGHHSRPNVDIIVHELTHVFQFEKIGGVYLWQALRAQQTEGYKYGGPEQLVKDRDKGCHFRDYNREQQGQIAEDYYDHVISRDLPADDATRLAYEPFIAELRRGEL